MKQSIEEKAVQAGDFVYEHRRLISGIILGVDLALLIGSMAFKKGYNRAMVLMLAAIHSDKDQASEWVETILSKYWTPHNVAKLEKLGEQEWKPFIEEFLKQEGAA